MTISDAGTDLPGDAGAPDARDDGSVDAGATLSPGATCPTNGASACATGTTKTSLLCTKGTWASQATCSAAENCDRTTGKCASIVTGCSPSTAVFCKPGMADVLVTCGPDLVSATEQRCAGTCSSNACQAPTCGDRKTEGTEECDDGNDVKLDGCHQCRAEWIPVLGNWHTCVYGAKGVKCWGNNEQGAVGLGDQAPTSVTSPSTVTLPLPVTSMAGSVYSTCAVSGTGDLRCWGDNRVNQLGVTPTGQPPTAPSIVWAPLGNAILTGVASVSAGGYTTCARSLAGGEVRCWGDNTFGQTGVAGNVWVPPTNPVLTGVASVENGVFHTCALFSDGRATCWGANGYGQTGVGSTPSIVSAPPSAAVVAHAAVLAAGGNTTCAISESQDLFCWGSNDAGQLGSGVAGGNVVTPPLAPILSNVKDVALGGVHTCALSTNGDVRCWGTNSHGQVGNGSSGVFAASAPPVLTGARKIAATNEHTCALLESGEVKCWGFNDHGQLGYGDLKNRGDTPDTVPALLPSLKL